MDFKIQVPEFHKVRMTGPGFHDEFMPKLMNHHKKSSEFQQKILFQFSLYVRLSHYKTHVNFYTAFQKQTDVSLRIFVIFFALLTIKTLYVTWQDPGQQIFCFRSYFVWYHYFASTSIPHHSSDVLFCLKEFYVERNYVVVQSLKTNYLKAVFQSLQTDDPLSRTLFLVSFDRSQKFRTITNLTFRILLQEK